MDPQISPSQNQIQPEPTPFQPVNETTNTPDPIKKKHGGLIALIVFISVLLIAVGVATYIFVIYIPNKPENVFKKAVLNLSKGGNYTVNGSLDQGNPNVPEYTYSIKTDGTNYSAHIDASTFMMSPSVDLEMINGKTYIKTTGWMDSAELATHYTNTGEKGIQEYLAEFAEKSGVYGNQDKWMQVDSFVLDNPSSTASTTPKSPDEAGISIESIGNIEQKDGKKLRSYTLSLTKEAFASMLNYVTHTSLPGSMINANNFPESLKVTVVIDTSTKTVNTLTYTGRPLDDINLSFTLRADTNRLTAPDNAPLVSSTLDYGIVNPIIFNPSLQSANDSTDRERIADLKGIAMAAEIYRQKHGAYPSRGAVRASDGLFESNFPSASSATFTDPMNRFTNMNGSQYTYIGQTAEGNETCGGLYFYATTQNDFSSPDCDRFWVVTNLNNGQEFKLTSPQ